jgi:biopolymer transport protein ExbB
MKRCILVFVAVLGLTAVWCAGTVLAQESSAPPAAKAGERITMWYLIKAGGYVSIFIWLCSAALVALAIEEGLGLRRKVIMPTKVLEGFNRNVEERKYQEAYEIVSRSDSFLGRVLASGLSKLPLGYPTAVQHMLETGEEESVRLEQRVGYISVIGVIAPMLGLLGTVTGMVGAFIKIHELQEAVKPADMARGVYEALITTVEGLIVAIPAIAIYSIYRNRVQRLVMEVGIVSEEMMGQFNPATRVKAAQVVAYAAGPSATNGPASPPPAKPATAPVTPPAPTPPPKTSPAAPPADPQRPKAT